MKTMTHRPRLSGLLLRTALTITVATLLVAPSDAGSAIPECQPRSGLPNFFAKLEAGGPVRIAYLGGSITDAWGWRDLSRDWFAKEYPQAKVGQIRASISGTNAEFGACRLKNHVLRHTPDLVFVEFAVNGAGATDQRAIESVEGIVRQIRRHDPKTDVCLVFTVNKGMLNNSLKQGRSPQVVLNMKKVADHYGVPTIDFGPEIARLVDDGKLIFQGPAPANDAPPEGPVVFSTDGTHPLDAGHKLYLDAIVRSMPAIKAVGQPGPHPLPKPLEKDNWENGSLVAIDAPGVTRSAGWQKIAPPDDTEKRQRISEYFPSVWETTKAGDTLEFTFEGTGFGLSGFRGMAAGLFRVTVDGRRPLKATFSDPSAERVSHKAWFYPDALPRGQHRVKIEFLSELPDQAATLKKEGKNDKQTDTAPPPVLQLAAILLAGSLTP